MRQTLKHPPQCNAEYGAQYGAEGGAARGAPYPLALKPGGYGAPLTPGRAAGGEYGAEYGAVVSPAAQREAQTITPAAQREAGIQIDAKYVEIRLEDAGRALLALPSTGYTTRLRVSHLEVVQNMAEAYGWTEKRLRPPMPSAAAIDRMDAAYAWLALIPDGKFVIRRIVAARSLVHPLTDRHLFPWRRLGDALGADHKAVQRWWSQGVDMIARRLLDMAAT